MSGLITIFANDQRVFVLISQSANGRFTLFLTEGIRRKKYQQLYDLIMISWKSYLVHFLKNFEREAISK